MSNLDALEAQWGGDNNKQNATTEIKGAGSNLDQLEAQWSAAAQETQQPTPSPQTDPNDQGAFMAGVENFNRVFGNMAEGTMQLVAKAVGSNTLENKVNEVHNNLQASADKAAQAHPIAAGVGTVAGIVGSAALPLGAVGKGVGLMDAVATNAAAGLGYGFLNYAPNMQDRFQNAATGGLLGAAAPVALSGLKSIPKAIKGVLKGSDDMSTSIGRIIKGKASAVDDVANITSAKNKVQDMLDDFVPGGKKVIEGKQEKLYKALTHIDLDDATTTNLKTNPVISEYLDDLSTKKFSSKKILSDNNFAKLDQVKQNIDKDLFNDVYSINSPAQGGLKQALDSETKLALMQARNQIVDTLTKTGDAAGVDYAGLRKMGELKSLYTKLSDTLKQTTNLRNLDPTFDPDAIVQNKGIGKLYDVLAGTDLKKEYLVNAVSSAGGDTDNVKGIISLLNRLRNNTVDKVIHDVGKSSIMDSNASKSGLMSSFINKMLNGRYNNEVIKLMSSGPQLQSKLADALSKQESKGLMGVLKSLAPLLNSVKNKTLGKTIPERATSSPGKLLGIGVGNTQNQLNEEKGYLAN